MKVIHKIPCGSNEEALRVALVLKQELGRVPMVLEDFTVLVIENHRCLVCDGVHNDKEKICEK